MKKPRILWLILLAAAVWVYFQPAPQMALTAKIKVENDGGIIAGRNTVASNQFGYDPYFTHENRTLEFPIQVANESVLPK